MQPAFTLADQNRCRQSYRLLQATVEDSRKAQMRLITARDRSNLLSTELSSLDARIAALTLELENKRSVLKAAREEVDDMDLRIKYNLDKRNGLCIRYVLSMSLILHGVKMTRIKSILSAIISSSPVHCSLSSFLTLMYLLSLSADAWRTRR
jgi:outer membrane murein-binding lipoprotein Lpp